MSHIYLSKTRINYDNPLSFIVILCNQQFWLPICLIDISSQLSSTETKHFFLYFRFHSIKRFWYFEKFIDYLQKHVILIVFILFFIKKEKE